MNGAYNLEKFTVSQGGQYDKYNSPIQQNDFFVFGKLNKKQKMVLGKSGKEILSSSNIFFQSPANITTSDKVTVRGEEKEVISIETDSSFGYSTMWVYLS